MIEFIFSGSAKINECGKKLFKRKNVRVLLTSCAILVNQLQSKRPNAVKQKYFIFILFVGSNPSRVYKMLPSFYNCCYLSWFTVIFCCQYQFRAIKQLTTFYCFYLFISQPVFLCLIFNSKSLCPNNKYNLRLFSNHLKFVSHDQDYDYCCTFNNIFKSRCQKKIGKSSCWV